MFAIGGWDDGEQAHITFRRRGEDWYVGAMTNETARTLEVDLSFLGDGRFEATLWQDGAAPTDVRREARTLDAGERALSLQLSSGGGAAIRLSPAQ